MRFDTCGFGEVRPGETTITDAYHYVLADVQELTLISFRPNLKQIPHGAMTPAEALDTKPES